jgi:hypothetical protein
VNRSLLALSIAAAGIGLTGAGTVARVSGQQPTAKELTSAGLVASTVTGRNESDDRDDVRQAIRRGESGTYIAEILRARDSALARWPDRPGNPLRVWIQPSSNVDDWHTRYVYEVHRAFVAWDTLQLPVRFQMVSDSADAHIHVTWIDHFSEQISGRTRWARDNDYWITDASIILAVHHRSGEVLGDDAMHAMALHEIGHLLGLPHLPAPAVMAAVTTSCPQSLTDADKRALEDRYGPDAPPH